VNIQQIHMNIHQEYVNIQLLNFLATTNLQ